MNETPQQYTERILGYQQGKAPLKVLTSTPQRLSKLLRGARKKRLRERRDPDQWSVAELLAHLADTEMVFGFRLRLILGSNEVTIQAFDQNIWAEVSRYRTHDPAISLAAFRALRERNVRLLKIIPKELWENYGMHAERGKETVTRVSEMMAGHDINHLRQIEHILKSRART